MNNLWTFGDSYTADYYENGKVLGGYLPYQEFKNGTLPDVWPTLLSKKLNLNLHNMAVGGSSNTKIFLRFIEVCDQITSDDVVIIGWTNNKRFVGANFVTNTLINILPCDTNFSECELSNNTIEEIFYNRTHPVWLQEIYGWIKLINDYCDLKNVKIYHWSSDDDLTDYFNKGNNEKFIPTPEGYHNLLDYLSVSNLNETGIKCRIIHETNELVKDGHFGEFGHIVQSEYIFRYLRG